MKKHDQDSEGPVATPVAPRLLMIDDDAVMRRSAGRFLSRAGFHVVSTDSGEAALHRLRSGEQFDVLVVDMQMPTMSGLEVLEAVAREFPTVPAGLWSASATLSDMTPRDRANAAFVVPKMSPIADLVEAACQAASGVRSEPSAGPKDRAWGLSTGVRRRDGKVVQLALGRKKSG